MKIVKKTIILTLFALLFIFGINRVQAASDFDFEKLNFDVNLNSDGTMDVVETWQVDINGTTNTLFKSFSNDGEKLTNISVSEIINNEEIEFTKSNIWKNHVDTDYFHGLFHDGDFEIAWGINKSSGKHTYLVKYTVNDAITLYNDCAELYWQFVGKYFEIPINQVTGRITLPNSVEIKDNLRVWGHGQLNGEINIEDNQTVVFSMSPYITGTYIEVRLAILEPEMFENSTKRVNTNKFESIIREEIQWAQEANKERQMNSLAQTIIAYSATGECLSIGIIFIILFIMGLSKYKGIEVIEPSQKFEYFREIPNENETPAEVAFIYYYRKMAQNTWMPRVLSSTMLDLSLKKYISFEVDDSLSKKEQVTVKLLDGIEPVQLKESEKLVLDLFRRVAKKNALSQFNMKEFEKYVKKHSESFLDTIRKIGKEAEKNQIDAGNYDKKMEMHNTNWNAAGVMTIISFAFISLFAMGIFQIRNCFTCFSNYPWYNVCINLLYDS